MQQTVSIATVAYNREDDLGFLAELTKIATPGYNFTNDESTVAELRSAMLQVNCYCPNGWFQMSESYANENSFKYGVCLLPVTMQATWLASKFSCRNHWNNGYLVNEYSQSLSYTISEVVRNNTAFKQPYMYFIGLSYVNGNWQWEQADGVDPILVQNWTDWNPGFPTASSTATVVVNMQKSSSSISTGWQNTNKDLASIPSKMRNVIIDENSNYQDFYIFWTKIHKVKKSKRTFEYFPSTSFDMELVEKILELDKLNSRSIRNYIGTTDGQRESDELALDFLARYDRITQELQNDAIWVTEYLDKEYRIGWRKEIGFHPKINNMNPGYMASEFPLIMISDSTIFMTYIDLLIDF
ncbi:hypothetical protein B9Z55_015478 [Caenorhabditis nigoni]|uniref:C-type lectin domain-containing protein n=1 Tax=Caenorhabditis nigoni TaxID=1611254 RepID=A0A2G5UAG3_9PELO|nr:hypothetical protein B9Z55_015478 [Caenorhabditis nigoni]